MIRALCQAKDGRVGGGASSSKRFMWKWAALETIVACIDSTSNSISDDHTEIVCLAAKQLSIASCDAFPVILRTIKPLLPEFCLHGLNVIIC